MVSQDEIHSVEERKKAVEQLQRNFADLPDKEQATKDLLALTKDEDSDVRRGAASALCSAFPHVTDKEQAWKDLLALKNDEGNDVRWGATYALCSAFQHVADKKQAWKDLLALTKDDDRSVRWRAVDALDYAFQHVTDNKQAWKDLLALTKDENSSVRRRAADALVSAFQHVADIKQAWKDLLALTKDDDRSVRWRAVDALCSAFQHVADNEQAWKDLLALTKDGGNSVRWGVASVLGSAFPHVTDKQQAWKDLLTLTEDEEKEMRVSANHSSGKACIFRATITENDAEFRKEMEKALFFFEKASSEASSYNNPAEFCLPFYRSFHVMTSGKKEADTNVDKYLKKAKNVVGDSESKEKLLEAVENLSKALKETQKVKEMTLEGKRCELDTYRQYCERIEPLLDTTKEKAPIATDFVKRGASLVNENIKQTITDIQEKTKALCKETKDTDTPYESLGSEIHQLAKGLSEKDTPKSEKCVFRIKHILEEFCKNLPIDKKGHACEVINEITDEKELVDQLGKIELALTYLQPNIEMELKHQNKPDNEVSSPTIGIITALPKEFASVKAVLENPEQVKIPGEGAGRRYFLGDIPSTDGNNHSVVISLGGMGNNKATIKANLLLEHFPSIKSIIMVGIAGGVPHPDKAEHHVRLGDIIISNEKGVIQYDFTKENTGFIEHRHSPRSPSASLLEACGYLQAEEIEGKRPWLKLIDELCTKLNVNRPSEETDILLSSTNLNEEIVHPHDSKRFNGQPKVLYGPIGSANVLLKNPLKRDELRDKFGVKAVEMEGSGIADATWNHEVGYLVIRGICDYCDSNKGDEWQDYAAIVAAAYTRALIESIH